MSKIKHKDIYFSTLELPHSIANFKNVLDAMNTIMFLGCFNFVSHFLTYNAKVSKQNCKILVTGRMVLQKELTQKSYILAEEPSHSD